MEYQNHDDEGISARSNRKRMPMNSVDQSAKSLCEGDINQRQLDNNKFISVYLHKVFSCAVLICLLELKTRRMAEMFLCIIFNVSLNSDGTVETHVRK